MLRQAEWEDFWYSIFQILPFTFGRIMKEMGNAKAGRTGGFLYSISLTSPSNSKFRKT